MHMPNVPHVAVKYFLYSSIAFATFILWRAYQFKNNPLDQQTWGESLKLAFTHFPNGPLGPAKGVSVIPGKVTIVSNEPGGVVASV